MTILVAIQASSTLPLQLAHPAARAIALSAMVALGLAAFRVKGAPLRLFTWTAVLYAALAMPLLEWMLPPLPIPTPAFLQASLPKSEGARRVPNQSGAPAAGQYVIGRSVTTVTSAPASRAQTEMASADRRSTPLLSMWSSFPWSAFAAAIYVAVAMIFLVRFFAGLVFGRRLLRASRPISETRLATSFASQAGAAGLASLPRVAEAEMIAVPLTMGVLRPTILLPSDWRDWDDEKLDAVLAHEVSHIARRDALTQRLSLLHRAIFWFSPLAWWLDRHLADLAEQASDEAALACGADRNNYARTLLGFFEALQAAPGRVWWEGVSMAKAGQAERQAEERVERILSGKGTVTMSMKKSIPALVLSLAVPLIYVAASVHPASARAHSAQQPTPTQPQSSPKPSDAPSPTPAPKSQAQPATDTPSTDEVISDGPDAPPMPRAPEAGVVGGVGGPVPAAPVMSVAPIGPVGQVAPVAPEAPVRHRGFSYHYGYDDDQRFVIVSGKTDSLMMSGSSEDARHVEKLRKNIPGDFIWFQRDEKSYVIRDQGTIDRARKLWAPQEELGKKQQELGKQQEVLGKQQQELGAKMEQIRVNVPDMSAELEKLKAELKQLSSGATTEQVGHIQSEIGDLQSKIGDIQSRAGDQQGKLGEEMGALGEKQGKLGQQQGELGRRQGELAEEASRQMKQLLDDAIAKGIAQPEI
jgi:beta-lactamase regulating signal transducer with metallopeptidase domain